MIIAALMQTGRNAEALSEAQSTAAPLLGSKTIADRIAAVAGTTGPQPSLRACSIWMSPAIWQRKIRCSAGPEVA